MLKSYNGMLFDHKKEWSTDICYNMDEPWKQAKLQNTTYIIHDSIYMKCLEKENRNRK